MKRGIIHMLIASALFAIMNALVYQTKRWNADESALMASFIRVFVNTLFVVVMALLVRDRNGRILGIRGLLGDMSWSLWLRGIFGTLSVISVFYAVHAIGVGEASFLNASNAIWVGLFSPWILKQVNTRLVWAAIGFGIFGLYLLYQPEFDDLNFFGRSIGLLSGLFGAAAYVMVSRAGRTNHPLTVVFYLTVVATAVHLVLFMFAPPIWPHSTAAWWLLVGAGLSGSLAQVFMTLAYQEAPAAIAAATSYAGPVFSMIISVVLFQVIPNARGLIGAVIVLLSGVALPLIQSHKARKILAEQMMAGSGSDGR